MSSLDHVAGRFELPAAHTPANALADRFLHVALYLTVVSSFFVVVEPAPYEYLAAVLGVACILARVSLNRIVLVPFLLLLIRDASGAIGLLNILDFGWIRLQGPPSPLVADFDYPDSIRFLGTSFYLGLSGVMIACIVSQDTSRRIATLRSAYIMAAIIASVYGALGYFATTYHLFPGLDFLNASDRAQGGFKGPNDLGAFLIPALLWLIQSFFVDKIRLRDVVAAIVIFTGLLLTFSRGAWGTLLFSTVLMTYFLFVTQTDARSRNRIIVLALAGLVVAVGVFGVLSTTDGFSRTFEERSQFQAYDINADNRSRLNLEEDSLREVFNHPLGMGPWGFAHATNWVSHETFLGTMLNHGWIGGCAYLTLIVLSLIVGFRSMWLRTRWQPFLIATYASFIAMVLEGIWGDTDHWRHFYVMLGLVWGLVAATHKATWTMHAKTASDRNALLSGFGPISPQNAEQPL
ncbi:MAG: hypothetical protein WAM75_22610 [Xanthobacteraceae bacterium]